MSGLYIHVPFCKSRCIYCGFYSTTFDSLRHDYVKALCQELRIRSNDAHSAIETIYIGGGTPSQLQKGEIQEIFDTIYKYYSVETNMKQMLPEITIECNPDDIDEDFSRFIADMPVNRVSMGAQSFSDRLLKFVGRRHNAEQIPKSVDLLRNAGVRNISIDLMFGFPGEDAETWHSDLTKAVALGVEHLSAYSLMFEEGTPLYKLLKDGKVKECGEDLSLAMFNDLIDTLSDAGYEHYEISNFAKPGFRSKHNSSYWHDVPYLGIGASAHSYDGVSRQWNVSDTKKYISSINNGIIPAEKEILSMDSHYDDVVMTSLRTCEGIDIAGIERTFGEDYLDYLRKEARKHIENGLLAYDSDGKHLALTRKGIFVSDDVMSDLMHV